eukprot:213381-Rhodomonas_salina.1
MAVRAPPIATLLCAARDCKQGLGDGVGCGTERGGGGRPDEGLLPATSIMTQSRDSRQVLGPVLRDAAPFP